ncbi:DUF2550 domain-containing protein [Nocardioides sp. TRM66260-LWL]|uniref:DUF2550 domain-containing protein n=1 Tax=Nocardioides sp. TRM66260-LWL TaxID=2874478 RepID=UPI001CC6C6EA|nr:DUF2550 domain-containing protein [Nocardioides sp. TRM66260-LWL]MBZ5734251.1 DUF2550 domain-containing protein [Nocardioides sp. TRM66260-LWL]
MPWWELALDAVGALLGLFVAYGLALVVRRRVIARDGGTFELSYRARSTRTGRGWLLGVGRYSGERLEWFRFFSLAARPKISWERSDLVYAGRRDAVGPEEMSLYPDHVVIVCEGPVGDVELAMAPASLTGFQAWLEAKPPGAQMP